MWKISPVFKQFFAIVCCNILTLSFGASSGWSTINYNELQMENITSKTRLEGPLSKEEASLLVSIMNVGGLVGNFAIIPISQIFGIKRTIQLFALPLILSSLLIIWAENVYYLYASNILNGFVGGAIVVGIPTLIIDISEDSVRGALNSLYDPTFSFGIIVSFLLGSYLDCVDQAKMLLIGPIVTVILLFFVPESPEHWTQRNKQKRAIKSYKYYKGMEKEGKEATQNELNEFLQKMQLHQVEKGDITETDDDDSKLTIRDFFMPKARKAFLISFTGLVMSFVAGPFIILMFVTDIFKKTGSSLSEKNSSLLVSIVQTVATLVFLNIVERINRRTLFVWSSVLTAGGFFFFAAYCHFLIENPLYEWMAPLCFSCIIFFGCMGMLPIPYIITYEIFPRKIQQTSLSIAVSMMWIVSFFAGMSFPVLLDEFGLFLVMTTLGAVCTVTAIFGIAFIPETRGKSYEQIMKLLE